VTADLHLRNAEVVGVGVTDVWVRDGLIVSSPVQDALEIDCRRAALLPGLHDHHLHLLATSAMADSVPCGPPDVTTRVELAARLAAAVPRSGWVRGVGYAESVAGDLDALTLDDLGGAGPVRVQHRSGALWVLNTAGMEALGLASVRLDGIERDAAGQLTGRLWRLDGWLRERLGPPATPDLARLSSRLSSYGITGVTDATPGLTPSAAALLASGVLFQRLTLLGSAIPIGGARLGPFKIVLEDHELPSWDAVVALIRAARPRPVALHSVTRASLVLALAVLAELGIVAGDRIEHAAVAPPDTVAAMASLGVTVVTQPSLLRTRGASYLDEVDLHDQRWLWPLGSLLDAGVPVGLSSDAPYGELDPWLSVAAAVDRETSDDRVVGSSERVGAWQALRGFLTSPEDPGGAERTVAPGERADLALLDQPLAAALAAPADVRVAMTAIGGRVVHWTMPR
jgi:predicted amidohydrolase YtcJ